MSKVTWHRAKGAETGGLETASLHARVSSQALKEAIDLLIKALDASPTPSEAKLAAIASLREWSESLVEFSTRVAHLADGEKSSSKAASDEA